MRVSLACSRWRTKHRQVLVATWQSRTPLPKKAQERHVNVTYVTRQCLPHYSHLCQAHMDIPLAKRNEVSGDRVQNTGTGI